MPKKLTEDFSRWKVATWNSPKCGCGKDGKTKIDVFPRCNDCHKKYIPLPKENHKLSFWKIKMEFLKESSGKRWLSNIKYPNR